MSKRKKPTKVDGKPRKTATTAKKPKPTPNNNNKWKIVVTNDEHLTGHKKSRPGVIVADNGATIKIMRITSTDGKEKKVKNGHIVPIGQYRSLPKNSAVDRTVYSKDKKTGKKLKATDKKVFRDIKNEKLRVNDRRKVVNLKNKSKK